MELLTKVEELKTLTPGERFFIIKNGEVEIYRYCAVHPTINDAVVAIKDDNHLGAKVIGYFNFVRTIVLKGRYDSVEVGNYIISQLNESVATIKEVYFQKD